jgi:WD40 repeat protein
VQRFRGPKKGVRCVAFSPDGKHLVAGGYDGSVRLWNFQGGEPLRLRGSGRTPRSLAWAADSSRVFWSEGGEGNFKVFAATLTGEKQLLLSAPMSGGSIGLSRDGRTLYAATHDAIRRLDLAAGVELPAWPTRSPGYLAVSPDGKTLASTHPLSPGAFERVDAFHVVFWDTATGQPLSKLRGCGGYFDGVAFSSDGTRLATLAHTKLQLWALPAGREIAAHESKKFFTSLAFSPDGRRLATASNDQTVCFWDGETGALRQAFHWQINKVLTVAFAPDGMRAAAGGEFGHIVVWDVD